MGYFHSTASVDKDVPIKRLEYLREVLRLTRKELVYYIDAKYNAYYCCIIGRSKVPWKVYFNLLALFARGTTDLVSVGILINAFIEPQESGLTTKRYGRLPYSCRSELVTRLLKEVTLTKGSCWFVTHGDVSELLLYIRVKVLGYSRGQVARFTDIEEDQVKRTENKTTNPTLSHLLTLCSLLENHTEVVNRLVRVTNERDYREQFLPSLRASEEAQLFKVRDELQISKRRSVAVSKVNTVAP